MTDIAEAHSSFAADDERETVHRILAGDRSAFELLMRRHNRRLYRLARATLRDAAEAEDALQAAYLSATDRSPGFVAMPRFSPGCPVWCSMNAMDACAGKLAVRT